MIHVLSKVVILNRPKHKISLYDPKNDRSHFYNMMMFNHGNEFSIRIQHHWISIIKTFRAPFFPVSGAKVYFCSEMRLFEIES
jgi:hypothetical protein